MKFKKQGLETYSEKRPWGSFERFTQNELSTVKLITVAPHEELSLQYHEKRSEFWKVISGNPVISIGKNVIPAYDGDEFFVAPKENHRIKAQNLPVLILEIALGEFDEKDIVRLDDKYGRS
jgi:mannose-1-phosphate guanylyltransferase/mannose-1-phosphate guanylyltransferase/mannose-6-phosphate isomerase